jgi:hypothetical protein
MALGYLVMDRKMRDIVAQKRYDYGDLSCYALTEIGEMQDSKPSIFKEAIEIKKR